jgi:hypothetical protein
MLNFLTTQYLTRPVQDDVGVPLHRATVAAS